MLLLVDADILVFRASASCERRVAEKAAGNTEPDEVHVAIGRMKQMMEKIQTICDSTDYRLWFTGGKNFRYSIFPNYKASRKDKPKPTHFQACKDYAISQWRAEVTDGIEADDAIVMNHVVNETVICSSDKDFRSNAVGHHYNFTLQGERHVGVEYIEEFQRKANFLDQMLKGDAADDIRGPFGYSAHRTVERYLSEHTGLSNAEIIRLAYDDKWGEIEGPKWERLNYRLLRMLQKMSDLDDIRKEKASGMYPNFEEGSEEDQGVISKTEGQATPAAGKGQDTGSASIRFGAR